MSERGRASSSKENKEKTKSNKRRKKKKEKQQTNLRQPDDGALERGLAVVVGRVLRDVTGLNFLFSIFLISRSKKKTEFFFPSFFFSLFRKRGN